MSVILAFSPGDLREPQPKAAGSSTMVALTNSLVVDWLRMSGARTIKEAFVAPVATGMAMTLVLMALRDKRPDAKYVIWSRIDQKSCFKVRRCEPKSAGFFEGTPGSEPTL